MLNLAAPYRHSAYAVDSEEESGRPIRPSGHQPGEYRRRHGPARRSTPPSRMLVVALHRPPGKAEVARGGDRLLRRAFWRRQDNEAFPSASTSQRRWSPGYGKTVRQTWLFFNPDERLNIGEIPMVWCMFIREMERKEDGTVRGFAVPSSTTALAKHFPGRQRASTCSNSELARWGRVSAQPLYVEQTLAQAVHLAADGGRSGSCVVVGQRVRCGCRPTKRGIPSRDSTAPMKRPPSPGCSWS